MLQTKIDKIPFSSHLPPNSLATLRSAFAFFVNDSGAIPLMRQMEHFIVLSYLFT